MAKGKRAKPGDTYTSSNGYHYTRAETKWRLTHHLIAEDQLGRELKDDERVVFSDKDRTNLTPSNIVVQKKGRSSTRRRRAQIEARIAELQAELEMLDVEEMAS